MRYRELHQIGTAGSYINAPLAACLPTKKTKRRLSESFVERYQATPEAVGRGGVPAGSTLPGRSRACVAQLVHGMSIQTVERIVFQTKRPSPSRFGRQARFGYARPAGTPRSVSSTRHLIIVCSSRCRSWVGGAPRWCKLPTHRHGSIRHHSELPLGAGSQRSCRDPVCLFPVRQYAATHMSPHISNGAQRRKEHSSRPTVQKARNRRESPTEAGSPGEEFVVSRVHPGRSLGWGMKSKDPTSPDQAWRGTWNCPSGGPLLHSSLVEAQAPLEAHPRRILRDREQRTPVS